MIVAASVVISTLNEGDALADTVASVSAANPSPREVIIVDDGSTDASTDIDWPPHVRLLRQPHHGIATARNHGAREATQPVVVFLDAHCTVDPCWLTPLIETLNQHRDALVGPAVHDAAELGYAGCGAQIVDPLLTYRWRRAQTNGGPHPVGLLPGGCLGVGRELFLASGGFGPLAGFGFEDVDLSLRWWRTGRPLLGVPASAVTHQFRATPPYRREHQAWLENLLRTALRHLDGDSLTTSLTACSRFGGFGTAIATVLAEPWLDTQRQLRTTETRPITRYLREWAPDAFTDHLRSRC